MKPVTMKDITIDELLELNNNIIRRGDVLEEPAGQIMRRLQLPKTTGDIIQLENVQAAVKYLAGSTHRTHEFMYVEGIMQLRFTSECNRVLLNSRGLIFEPQEDALSLRLARKSSNLRIELPYGPLPRFEADERELTGYWETGAVKLLYKRVPEFYVIEKQDSP